jgi:hypothetical protein
MLSILGTFCAAIVTAAIGYWFRRALRSSGPFVLDGDSGAIRPDRWSGWFITLIGLLMACLSIWAAFTSPFGAFASVGVVLGLTLAAFMSPSVTSIHAVNWNLDRLEGPATLFGWTLGASRTAIEWTDIVASGKTSTGYWYVEAADGRRVHWSYLYPGYPQLTAAIRARCPNLPLPEDMA